MASMSSAVFWRGVRTWGGGGVAGIAACALAVLVLRRGARCWDDEAFVRRPAVRGVMSTGGARDGAVGFAADEDVIGREVLFE